MVGAITMPQHTDSLASVHKANEAITFVNASDGSSLFTTVHLHDFSGASTKPVTPSAPGFDALQAAVQKVAAMPPSPPSAPVRPVEKAPAHPTTGDTTAEKAPPHVTTGDTSAEKARTKLAEEALSANPAEMRRLFPLVYGHVSLNHNEHLDTAEIDKGLANPSLAQNEKDFLALLKDGYQVLSLDYSGDADKNGVSANSLAIIDRAMNPKLNENPLYKSKAIGSLASGLAFGVSTAVYDKGEDAKTRLIDGGLTALASVAALELVDLAELGLGQSVRRHSKKLQSNGKTA
jgi:hypothetical protein